MDYIDVWEVFKASCLLGAIFLLGYFAGYFIIFGPAILIDWIGTTVLPWLSSLK